MNIKHYLFTLSLTGAFFAETAKAQSIESLLNNENVAQEIKRREQLGWEQNGDASIINLYQYYATNSVQGQQILLNIPMGSRRHLSSQPVMAVFSRGASLPFTFKKFVDARALASSSPHPALQ